MTRLGDILRAEIQNHGPIPVSAFMAQALGHPEHGYYRRADPLGRGGDFITAPEISQMFGELIGAWCSVVWRAMGQPDPVILCELGPGRGTLMADLLRAAAMDAPFRKAIRIHLVETSPPLRARQAETLAEARPIWHDTFDSVPSGPILAVANEFFDALPIRQFIRRSEGWHERMIDFTNGTFAFVDGPVVAIDAPPASVGAIFETSDAARGVASQLGARLAKNGGAALIIDYGHVVTATGDTLQAVRRHARAEPLADPGEADLTAHVDFQALAGAARPTRAWGPVTQGAFLRGLGIELRADRLMRSNPAKAREVELACGRLIDVTAMGTLFKTMALTDPAMPAPPGFEP